MPSSTARFLTGVLVAMLLTGAAGDAAAQPAPYRHYRTLDTPHFNVHTAPGLEREGRVAAAAAERAYGLLSRELVAPRGVIDLVVSDDADFANGNATTVPGNRINIFAAPPVENEGLRFNDDWIQIVVTHELTHIFHLDRVRGFWAAAQHVFGRSPFLFPNIYGPAWLTEGLAVYYESRLTPGGRLNEQSNRIIARAAARDARLPQLNQLSLGSPDFPGGEGVYDYGALFIQYLAATRGDSAVGRFVERQSGQLIPFRLNRSATQGFGISFNEAFAAWRDSVARSVDSVTAPLPGWRQLTARSLYAPVPRWRDDNTIVYSATTGRETNAAWELHLDGRVRRLGRRDGRGANVPLPDGSLLYSGLDYTGVSVVRSDLYRQWPDGRVQRLTTGARLIQPDARRDGTIVAVKLDAARSSLVLLDSAGGGERTLRRAEADETWSEPAWSPDGRAVAAVHRRHGGEFSLDVIDVATGAVRVFDRGRYVIASPRWTGTSLMWTSERLGSPNLVRSFETGFTQLIRQPQDVALFSPDLGPSNRQVAATSLRGDGYHVGIAMLPGTEHAWYAVRLPDSLPAPAPADTQTLAAGDYHDYSPWRSLLPRFWYPVIEGAPTGDTRFGAATTGVDVLGRHSYAVYAAVPTSGRQPVAALFYRYAGLRRPWIDVSALRDWQSEAAIFDQSDKRVGTLIKGTQDLSVAATFLRPRVRTSAAVSLGVGVERRRFATDPSTILALLDSSFRRTYDYPRAFVGATWANVQRPALSISPEDGVALAFTARERYRSDAPSTTASLSVVGTTSGYKSLDLPGFAHHVLALRVAAGWADRRSATAFEVGGTSGSTFGVLPGYEVGEGRRTFGVRGFDNASVYGTSAVAGSLEYRAPLRVAGRGLGQLPLFLDRSSVTAFADAGTATCAANPLYPSICAPSPFIGRTIASVGGEVGMSLGILTWDAPELLRLGVAVPVAGRELVGARAASVYVAFGLSY